MHRAAEVVFVALLLAWISLIVISAVEPYATLVLFHFLVPP